MDLKEWSLSEGQIPRHPWELARLDAVDFLLRRLKQASPTVLDFGCGDAFVAGSLSQRLKSAEVVAVDRAFTADAVEKIAPTLPPSVKLFNSLESAAAGMARPASLVLLLDVLEHCENDRDVLEALVESPAVAADAAFLITVPAYQSLFSKHDAFLGHYRRYSREQMVALVKEGGLEVEESSYFFSSLLLPRSAQVALERLGWSAKEAKGLGGERSSWADGLIRGVLKIDFRVCEALSRAGIRLPGLSCFVLARKKNGPSS